MVKGQEPRVGSEVRIFGVYNNKLTNKQKWPIHLLVPDGLALENNIHVSKVHCGSGSARRFQVSLLLHTTCVRF